METSYKTIPHFHLGSVCVCHGTHAVPGTLPRNVPKRERRHVTPNVSSRNILHHLNMCILHLTPSKNGGISSGNKKTLGSRFTNYLPSSRLQQQTPTCRSHHLNRQTAQCALILQTCPRIKASRSTTWCPTSTSKTETLILSKRTVNSSRLSHPQHRTTLC